MPDPDVAVERMAKKDIESRNYTVEEHDEFVKTLIPGDIISSKCANGTCTTPGSTAGRGRSLTRR